jgi:hypothetical protein
MIGRRSAARARRDAVDDPIDIPTKKRSALRDVSGTTVALTSLAVMGVAAIVSAPLWYWHRRKRKRTDALVAQTPADYMAQDPAKQQPADPAPAAGHDQEPPAGDAPA